MNVIFFKMISVLCLKLHVGSIRDMMKSWVIFLLTTKKKIGMLLFEAESSWTHFLKMPEISFKIN